MLLALASLLWLAAAVWQWRNGFAPDVTWLIVASERWLDGERIYRDILESNPPGAVYLYAPAIIIARALGVASEHGVLIWTFLLAAGAMGLAARILYAAGMRNRGQAAWMFLCASAFFVLMPMSTFAQREHVAALLTLPLASAAAARIREARLPWWSIVLTGLAGGSLVAIKPTLVLVPVCVYLAAAVASRRASIIFAPENWIGAALAGLYASFVYVFHPLFIEETLPFLSDVYLPARFAIVVLALPTFYVLVILLAHVFVAHRRDIVAWPVHVLLAAAAGFAISYGWQMKFFDYHAFPIAAFVLLAICMAVLMGASREDSGEARATPGGVNGTMRLVSAAIVVLCAGYNAKLYYGQQSDGALAKFVNAAGPPPRVAGLSNHLGPWMREIRMGGGIWVGSFGPAIAPAFAAWFRKNLDVGPDWNRRLLHWEDWTAEAFLRDLAGRRPDLLLIAQEGEFSWADWIAGRPELQEAMRGYRHASDVALSEGGRRMSLYRRIDSRSSGPQSGPPAAAAAR